MPRTAAGPSSAAADPPATSTGRRSRSGCLTCRSRRKKCDEKRVEGGRCERCFLASYRCEWPAPPGTKPVRSFKAGARGGGRAKKGEGSSSGGSPSMDEGEGEESATDIAVAPVQGSSTSPYAYEQLPPPLPPNHPPPVAGPASLPANQSFTSVYDLPHAPLPPATRAAVAAAYSPYTFPPPSAAAFPPLPPTAHQPSASFTPSSLSLSLSTAYPSAPLPTPDLPALLTLDTLLAPYASILESPSKVSGAAGSELDQLLASIDPALVSATTTTSVNLSFEGGGGLGSPGLRGERVLTAALPLESVGGPAEGALGGVEEIDLIYNDLTQEFMTGLPRAVVNITITSFIRVASSNAVGRNAAMATALLYRRHRLQSRPTPPSSSSLLGLPAPAAREQENEAEEQRLLVAARAHYEKALGLFYATEVPLETKLLAGFDLAGYQFDQHGTAATDEVLSAVEAAVRAQLGPRPLLSLHPLTSTLDLLLLMYAHVDVTACLYEPLRRPLFRYPSLPGSSSPSSSKSTGERWTPPRCDIQLHFGLPTALLLCIAATNALEVDLADGLVGEEEKRRRAGEIERAVRGWEGLERAKEGEKGEGEGGGAKRWVEMCGTAEMWRYAALIYLYQSIHLVGPLHPVLRSCTHEILSLSSLFLPSSPPASSHPSSFANVNKDPEPSYVAAPSHRIGPLFLAGTCCLSLPDRCAVRAGLKAAGDLAGYRDCLRGLERIWEETDRTGETVRGWRGFWGGRG
ncbi:hypothetical protein JCM8097_000677 [Rhodosporidiobolus ruineniae]